MEEKVNKVFQVDSDIIKKARTLDNYLIVKEEDENKSDNICAVYFSSNYIYFPNTKTSFTNEILKKNRFEWWNLRHPKANKHIFIRDIFKQWYLHGINSKLNSIESLSSFLKKEIEGYNAIFIGSSAGGYAAVLLGSMLNVNRVFAFNSQFYLSDLLAKSSKNIDPLIFREQNNAEISKYFNIINFIKNPSSIYYFHSNSSEWDVRQYKQVRDLKINVISVNTSIHGIPLLRNNLKKLFLYDEKKLIELTKYRINPIKFSIKIIGLIPTLLFLIQMLPNAFNKWIFNPLISFIIKRK